MKIYLVGGAVRDKLLGLPIKERDWVVVGGDISDMQKLGYKQVGKEFPVFLHPQTNDEYALARMERKVKPGYKGFTFDTSPDVKLEDDLIRRDLTINAMAWDEETSALIDPYHGKEDLEKKILRHVSNAFAEDPVRILRVGRFLSRYAHMGFHVAPETIELMKTMVESGEVDALVAERVWKELERALGEKNPEKFFEVLNQCHALPILFPHIDMNGPGIKALIAAATVSNDSIVRFAALLHHSPDPRKSIAVLCDRYRAPTAYKELAKLTALHYADALRANTLSADELLQLFTALDVFRREDRFKNFLNACDIIAKSQNESMTELQLESYIAASKSFDLQESFLPESRKDIKPKSSFNAEWLMDCALVAKSVDVQPLIAEGLDGNALAAKLKLKRREKIAAWIAKK